MQSKVVLFRLTDDEAIYVADLEAGTVKRTDPAATDADQRAGVTGVDFALASRVRSSAASHLYFPSR